MDFMYLWGLGSEPPALGREDPLEKGMATLSSILVWRIPRTEESGWLQSMGLQRIGHYLHTHRYMSALVAPHPYVVMSFWEAIILTEYEKEKRYDTERWTSQVSSVQLISCVQLFETPWTAARIPCPSPTPGACSHSCPSSWWCHPTISSSVLFSSCLQFSQHQGLFQWTSFSHQVAKYWSFNFSISPSNEYSGLISFRIDWFNLLVVQGILKSLLQHHSSKASVLWCSAFFMVHISHPCMTTGKTIV